MKKKNGNEDPKFFGVEGPRAGEYVAAGDACDNILDCPRVTAYSEPS